MFSSGSLAARASFSAARIMSFCICFCDLSPFANSVESSAIQRLNEVRAWASVGMMMVEISPVVPCLLWRVFDYIFLDKSNTPISLVEVLNIPCSFEKSYFSYLASESDSLWYPTFSPPKKDSSVHSEAGPHVTLICLIGKDVSC